MMRIKEHTHTHTKVCTERERRRVKDTKINIFPFRWLRQSIRKKIIVPKDDDAMGKKRESET